MAHLAEVGVVRADHQHDALAAEGPLAHHRHTIELFHAGGRRAHADERPHHRRGSADARLP
eukprot:7890103-Pyramimonas_sp.AAC.1